MTDDNSEKITDTLIITRRFRSSNEFSMYIEENVKAKKISYMDAVIEYCDKMDIDIDSIGPLVNQSLREKIQFEAEQANLIKPKGHLPI